MGPPSGRPPRAVTVRPTAMFLAALFLAAFMSA